MAKVITGVESVSTNSIIKTAGEQGIDILDVINTLASTTLSPFSQPN